MSLRLHGVDISHPFSERSILLAVKAELSLEKKLRDRGLGDSKILEEMQIAAKDFYTALALLHGRGQVDEFIGLFNKARKEYIESQLMLSMTGGLRLLWIQVVIVSICLFSLVFLTAKI